MKGAKFGLTENMRLQLTAQEEAKLLATMDQVINDFYSNDGKITRTEEDGCIWFHEVSDCIYCSKIDGFFMGYLAGLGFNVDGERQAAAGQMLVLRNSVR